jgi:hypothetical protein
VIIDTAALSNNELDAKKFKLIETTKLNKYGDTELRGLGLSFQFSVPYERP